ncbi:PREDICTED: ephrin-A4 [Myotis brandtii]|uniref:ephrin-A4 n=1 Tax=Myotis brandtii TaxID=109478 RepID=UPI00070409C9|nr:PREDICTED: ephrin-A4 [Myotis brandtii]
MGEVAGQASVRAPNAEVSGSFTQFTNIYRAPSLCRTLLQALRTRLLRGDAVVELGLNDYLDIFCPHYEGPGPPEGPETFALYMVDWSGYEACQAQGPGAFKRWECSLPFAPFGPVKFSEKIQRFTPFSLGFEFLPGETYYYISVPTPGSSGQCLRLQVSVCCKESRARAPPRRPGGGAPAACARNATPDRQGGGVRREARGSEVTPEVLAPSSQAEEEPRGSCRPPWASGAKAS